MAKRLLSIISIPFQLVFLLLLVFTLPIQITIYWMITGKDSFEYTYKLNKWLKAPLFP